MSSVNPSPYLLEINDLTVDYGPLMGLDGLSLHVKRGAIHAIVGTQGSGKSTLVKVISGIVPKTEGTILYDNRILEKHSPENAIKLGISAIHQETSIFPGMSAYKNIFLNREMKKYLLFHERKKMREKALEALKMLSLPIDLDTPLMFYNIAQQQMVEVAKIICFPSKLLLVDEISTRFSPEELEKFHHLLSILREKGTTIIYATGNMSEIYNFASHMTVLKEGKNIKSYTVSGADKMELVKLTYSSMHSRKDLEATNIELFFMKNYYEKVINNLNSPLIVTDTRGKIVFINDKLTELLGIEKAKYLDRPLWFVLSISKNNFEMLKNGRSMALDGSDIKLSKPVNVEIQVSPFYDEDDAFMGTISLFNETTGTERTEDIEKDTVKTHKPGKVISGIAHEINNPLGIILNYLQLIKTGTSLSQVREESKMIEKEVMRIKNILRHNIGENAGEKKSTQAFHVKEFFMDIEKFIQPSLEDKDISIEIDVSKNTKLSFDQDRLRQVVLNLILNAIEAMPMGGTISVLCKDINLNNTQYIMLVIMDSGHGIKDSDLKHIFEPFFSTKRDSPNRGLGLTLSRDIVEQAGGHIEVESFYKRGSTFRVFLPVEVSQM